MSEYEFLCPQCGHAFLKGTSFTECPECRVPLRKALEDSSAEFRNLPALVDLSALMQTALSEQQAGEDIDDTLQRVLQRDFPETAKAIYRMSSMNLDMVQQGQNVTRDEAAKEMAEGCAELRMRPDGRPELKFIRKIELGPVRIKGAEHLSRKGRARIVKKVTLQALREGRSIEDIELPSSFDERKAGCLSLVLAAVLTALLGCSFYCR